MGDNASYQPLTAASTSERVARDGTFNGVAPIREKDDEQVDGGGPVGRSGGSNVIRHPGAPPRPNDEFTRSK